jgi:DNA mismatch repair protein MutS2
VDEATAREARRLVEEAVAATTEAGGQGRTGTAGDGRGLTVGGRARMGSGAVGVVRELRPDGTAMLDVGNVRLVAPLGDLTPVVEPASRRAAEPSSRHAAEPPDAAAESEIDLRGLRVEELDDVLARALDAAVLADLPYLRIIHGKGTGVLRERVRALLESDPRVSHFALAPANQGGTGVTVAELRA